MFGIVTILSGLIIVKINNRKKIIESKIMQECPLFRNKSWN